ncbi:unnamed protein product [Medioppia subpectinata]|uniref:LIM zinc-binding domain-containing protein n=1 Tax=Medioppia subpectinata TaxID=1979941 RepID=A0A7R9PWW2_9ACAR|nr:unnamed protein product [Medioppia subpectinata]CAG2103324.1 unnamed protein product [Medioppia subpectinata]
MFSMSKQNNNRMDCEPQVNPSVETKPSHYPQLSAPNPLHGQTSQTSSQPILVSESMTSCSPQISSSATSGFLQQKLTQPLTALLKQRSEHKNSNISQFFIHFKGIEWREEQLKYQMPSHDLQMFKLQTNEVKFVRNQQRKAQIKPQLFLNKTINYCFKCRTAIENGSYGVKISVIKNGNQNIGYTTTADEEESAASKVIPSDPTHPTLNGSTALYHIQCFTCEECQEVLVDLKAYLYTNSDSTDGSRIVNTLYCSRHFVELFKPRCQSCDHLIFDEECTEAEGKAWHLGHFACNECKRSLGGQQYIMADPSKQSDKKALNATNPQIPERKKQQLPYCLTCFDILFGELCEECGELIGCDVGAISHEGRSWHAIDGCFKCNQCSKPLLGKPFLPAFDGRIYCSITCSQQTIQRNRNRDRRKQRPPHNSVAISIEDNHISQTNVTNFNQNFTNNIMNQQMLDYIQRYQQFSRAPDYVMEYMKQQLIQNGINGGNDIIGATIECGSSLSEDERTNHHVVDHKILTTNHNNNYNQMTSKTSSDSSSLNVNTFDANNSAVNRNAMKYNPSITSSSNETTPLLLRSLEEKAKQLTQTRNQTKQLSHNTKIFSEQSLPQSESPSQTSQADQSSNSSIIDNNNSTIRSINADVIQDVRNSVEVDTPSTQSTALQSTSSQTTPEINPRLANNQKSVTFDPSVKETTGTRRVNRNRRSRPTKRHEWSDNHSCSTCSTCSSSSSSSDDNFDYESTLERNRNQWLGTKIQYVSNDRKKNVTNAMIRRPANVSNGLLALLVAFGIGSGYYIFEPTVRDLIIEKSRRDQQLGPVTDGHIIAEKIIEKK